MKSTIPIFVIDLNGNTRSSGDVNSKTVTTNQVTISAVKYVELGKNLLIGSQKYCIDCYSLKTNKQSSIPVWWNGKNWTDALGNSVSH